MTEEEAQTKTCHETLAAIGGSDGVPSWHSPASCLGSQCMAWRWDRERPGIRVKNMAGEEFLVTAEVYARDWKGQPFTTEPAHGYCGKAGPL